MIGRKDISSKQLEHTCRLTGAAWGCYLYLLAGEWETASSAGLGDEQVNSIVSFLSSPSWHKWLEKVRYSEKSHYRSLKEKSEELGAARLYGFPFQNNGHLLVVGADQLSPADREVFQLLAIDFPPQLPQVLKSQFKSGKTEGKAGLSLDLREDLIQIINMVAEMLDFSQAMVAIRSGDDFRVEAVLGLNDLWLGQEFSLSKDVFIKTSVASKQAVVLRKPLRTASGVNTGEVAKAKWMISPLVLGQRVIGILIFGRKHEFSSEEVKLAEAIGVHVAPSVEKSIVYTESATYLQRFALLNDLAQLASPGLDLIEIVKRVEAMLVRTFGADSSRVWFLDIESGLHLTHPEGSPDLTYSRRIELSASVEGSVIETGKSLRIAKIEKRSRYFTKDFNIISKMVAPMRFRGAIIGVLALESRIANAFSEQDENLLSVVGSQLAGIFENIRFNIETHERASNLLMINEVVRDLLGLTSIPDIADRAAYLMAAKFNLDMVLVMILNEKLNEFVAEGVAGKRIEDIPKGFHFASDLGIPGQILETGESVLLKDASKQSGYVPIPGWEPGSGVWVPLRDGDKVFGVINVEFQQKGRVSENDLILIEAIAGPLSSVLINARQYAQLQGTIGQLRAVRETALDISADLDLEFLLKRVVNRVRTLVNARGAELGLINEEKDAVQVLVSENPWHDYTGYTFPFMEGISGRVAALGEPIVVADFNAWRGKSVDTNAAPFTTVAGVPLSFSGEVIGTLTVQDDRPNRAFTQEDILTLELLAPQLAIFIRNARLYQELEERVQAQRLAEERLVRSAKLAAVGEMAAAVAHELNNPLTTVTGFTELILETVDADSPEHEDLSLILREAQRSRDVVRRLLDFSRQSEFLRVDTDINDVISVTLALVHHQAYTSGIEVRVELWDEIPLIRADRNQMQQVLLNIIYNAIHAMPHGGVLVIQSMVERNDDGEWIGIKVRDTGLGISEENLDKIFEPFFTTKPSGEGTGLGLSVSYSIVSEHGGYIEVDSKEGEGSVFTIWLPTKIQPE